MLSDKERSHLYHNNACDSPLHFTKEVGRKNWARATCANEVRRRLEVGVDVDTVLGEVYYNAERKPQTSRSTDRKSNEKAPILRHRSEFGNELGDLYDVHRWFAAYHNHLVEFDMGFGTPNPPWSGKANLTGPWFSRVELVATSADDFVMTKGKGELPANAVQATLHGVIDLENMAPTESWAGWCEHHART